jgi:hypothetical protein
MVTATTCGLDSDSTDTVLVQVGGEACACVAANDDGPSDSGCSTLEVDGIAGETLYFAASFYGNRSGFGGFTVWTEDCASDSCASRLDTVAAEPLVPDGPLVSATLPESAYYMSLTPSCSNQSLLHRMSLFNLRSEETGTFRVNLYLTGNDMPDLLALALVDGEDACACLDADTRSTKSAAFSVDYTESRLLPTVGETDGYYYYESNRRVASLLVDLVAGEVKMIGVSPLRRFKRVPASFTLGVAKEGQSMYESCLNATRWLDDVLSCSAELAGTIETADDPVLSCGGDDDSAASSAGQALFLYRTFGEERATFTVCPTGESALVPSLSIRNDFCRCLDVDDGVVDEDTGCTSFTTTMRGAAVVIVSGADGSSGSFTITMDSDSCNSPCPYTAETVADMATVSCASAHRGLISDTAEQRRFGCSGLTETRPATPVLFVAPEDGDYLITTCTAGLIADTVLVVSSDDCTCLGFNDDRNTMSSHLDLGEYLSARPTERF